MKKLLLIVLVLTLVLFIPSPAFAMTRLVDNPVSSISDDTIDVISTAAFSALFTPQVAARSLTNPEVNPQVTYSYTFVPLDNNPSLADVSLTFVLNVANQNYPVNATGTVDAYPLSSGEVFWEGLIRGETTINDIPYMVLVGFSKLSSGDNIQAAVTIQAVYTKDVTDPVIFTFGECVITTPILQELQERETAISPNSFSESANLEQRAKTYVGRYALVGTDFVSFNSVFPITGTAQTSRGYFNSELNQFVVTIKSYCYNVQDYFESSGTTSVSIKEFEIRLIRDNDYTIDSYSYILGIESFDFGESNFNSGSVLLMPLFEDIMGYLNVPTSTITAIFDGLSGTVTSNDNTDVAYVNVSFGLFDFADFDDSLKGVPIVFQLGRNYNNYIGNSSYTFTTGINYRVIYTPTGQFLPQFIYIDGYDTSVTVSVTLEG